MTPPIGLTGEAYYISRDDFLRYLSEEVAPVRANAGLPGLDEKTAEECFRILNDFYRKWNEDK